METTGCIEVEERLEGYLRQNLAGAETAAVERHLRICATCRRSLALERELLALSAEDAAPAFAAITWSAVRRRRTTESSGELLARFLRLHRAAAAALVFRVLVDPWIQVEHQLRIVLLPARQILMNPFALLSECLTKVAADLGRQLTDPLLAAGRTIRIPVALHAH